MSLSPSKPERTSSLVATINLTDDLGLTTHCQSELYDPEDVCFITAQLLDNEKFKGPGNFLLLGKPKYSFILRASVQVSFGKCCEFITESELSVER